MQNQASLFQNLKIEKQKKGYALACDLSIQRVVKAEHKEDKRQEMLPIVTKRGLMNEWIQ